VPLSRLCKVLVSCFVFVAVTLAQSAPTLNVLTRMTVVESRYGSGAAFSVDVDQREYWITAKHILTGAQHPPYGTITEKSVSLRLLDPGSQAERWLQVNFSVLDAGKDIDIVVLAPAAPILPTPVSVIGTGFSFVTLGTDCEFLGYPSATRGVWAANSEDGKFYWMPFVKHCFVSSLPDRTTKAVILDGVNNPGFSGGPVIYRTGPDQKIIAVISGIVTEPAEVIPSLAAKKLSQADSQPLHEKVNLNSGFIVAYSIDPAIEAIRKNPMGPLRVSAQH